MLPSSCSLLLFQRSSFLSLCGKYKHWSFKKKKKKRVWRHERRREEEEEEEQRDRGRGMDGSIKNSQLKLNGWKQTTHQQFIGEGGWVDLRRGRREGEVNWNAIKQTLNRISSLIIDVDWIIIILQKRWRGVWSMWFILVVF